MRRAILLCLTTASAFASVGCLAPPERGLPLYAAGATAVPAGQVATLDVQVPFPSTPGMIRTFIQSVDGRDVATLPSPFELLPGCHVVETAPHWASTKARYIYFPGLAGTQIFPIRMRAGHAYTVVEKWSAPLGPLMTISVHAFERDPVGGQTAEISAAANDADVQACRAWTPPTS
jgi:hypothetical protein